MSGQGVFSILLVCVPGLEAALRTEAQEQGFAVTAQMAGGVEISGGWPEVWRANLCLRGCSRVLARIGSFRALHLAQLDKRARAFAWGDFLQKDVPIAVEASCKRSRIYHSKAAAQRIERALSEVAGITVSAEAGLVLKARIEDDLVTLSLDTSGDGLHKRGAKQAMAKAPMRETMAALFLRECGFKGDEPLLDPMCGSGTFVIEAAEMAAGLAPGRVRSFACELVKGFDAAAYARMKAALPSRQPAFKFFGSDRNDGAITAARANAERAGVASFTSFERRAISDITPPEGPAGLIIMNPPYGARIGDAKKLQALYAATGKVLRERFAGWRVGIITNDDTLARSMGLPLKRGAPVLHGGIRVHLYQARL
ncbi:MAG: class I SAM-dependent RNA methyltransferase [Alphaproteobacteria bacterium]|nr:class I SAM-dependent RNA methyltransferase [Alphaproteobacteria bacterium]